MAADATRITGSTIDTTRRITGSRFQMDTTYRRYNTGNFVSHDWCPFFRTNFVKRGVAGLDQSRLQAG